MRKKIGPARERGATRHWGTREAPPLTPEFDSSKAIHAELTGDDGCTALGVVARSPSPVLLLCRLLVAAGHDPARPLEAWRGPVLCLLVRSIGEAARLKINGPGTGFCVPGNASTAPPIGFSGEPAVDSPPTSRRAA